jgi:hypothetical protein
MGIKARRNNNEVVSPSPTANDYSLPRQQHCLIWLEKTQWAGGSGTRDESDEDPQRMM